MSANANPLEDNESLDFSFKQTVEFRCPDGSADIYLLLAGLTVAARHGLEMENALDYSKKTYVDIDIFKSEFKDKLKELKQLPVSCWESAECLEQQQEVFKKYDVFPDSIISGIITQLKEFNDKDIREEIKNDNSKMLELVDTYFHCG